MSVNEHKDFDSYWEDGAQYTLTNTLTRAEVRYLTRIECMFDIEVARIQQEAAERIAAAEAKANQYEAMYNDLVGYVEGDGAEETEAADEPDDK